MILRHFDFHCNIPTHCVRLRQSLNDNTLTLSLIHSDSDYDTGTGVTSQE